MNTLTVVIPAYNAEQQIGATITALCEALARIPSVETEVVVVDDGSTDATAARAEHAARGRVALRVVRQANAGRFLARKRGLDEASGETVLLLDSRVILEPGGLAFVAGRVDQGERVWNGHVDVLTAGNPYAAFMKAIAHIAWSDYLARPRTTSFGVDDFDRYPKGTGCFVGPSALLRDAVDAFGSHYGGDLRFVNDDTSVIRWIAARERINISPGFACSYEARTSLRAFATHGVHRGTVFVDGHLRRESRFFPGAVAFFPLSVAFAWIGLRRPAVVPLAAAGGAGAAGLAAARSGCTRSEARAFAALTPLYAVAHGAGMWRGLALLVRHRLRGRG